MLERARPWLAACAAAAIVAAGGAVFLHSKPREVAKAQSHPAASHSHPLTRVSYETPVGGQSKITLADGSTVILNTNSLLDINFSGKCRDVHLRRGEAYFDVVHDKARPFTVYADNYVVRDIGTAFDVHLAKAGQVEVGVTKGSVEVRPAGDGQASGTVKSWGVLTAGQNIVLGEKVERAKIVASPDLERRLAWRQGQLIYTGQPLAQVLADVSRYSDIQIELADPALENLPVGGAFRTDQIDAIFASLENNFGIHAEWVDPQHVRFTSAPEKAPSSN
jgi:transmembrane sensor